MNISIALRRAVIAAAEMKTLATTVLALGLMVITASHPRADTFACVNKSSGAVKVVPSCTVGTDGSPCTNNDTCVDLSLSSGENESWESCDEFLCIDTPSPDGSGGWGVTSLNVGTNASLTVTALQTSPCADGTITFTWRQQDFTYVSNGDTSATCSAAFAVPSIGGPSSIEVCSYTDFGHNDKSDSFKFTPNNPTSKALVTATVHTTCSGDEQASEAFPIAIQP